MIQLAPWAANYIGLPFVDKGRGPAYDCWGLVCLIYKEQFDIELPDYSTHYESAQERHSVAMTVAIAKKEWHGITVDTPMEGDIIILRLKGRPWHCAVSLGGDWMIHALKDIGTVRESWNTPIWRNRIEGFYRYA